MLAAGAGSRFGGGKLTAPFGGGVLLDHALAAALAAPARRVAAVTGADAAVADAVADFGRRTGQADRLRCVHARDHALGLAHSLKAGVAALPADADGVFVFLGDMPGVPHDVAARLVARLGPGVLAAAPTHQGRRGHPVLFARALFGDLAAFTGDSGAGALLARLGPGLVLEEIAHAGVLADVDTAADLAHWSLGAGAARLD